MFRKDSFFMNYNLKSSEFFFVFFHLNMRSDPTSSAPLVFHTILLDLCRVCTENLSFNKFNQNIKITFQVYGPKVNNKGTRKLFLNLNSSKQILNFLFLIDDVIIFIISNLLLPSVQIFNAKSLKINWILSKVPGDSISDIM